MKLLIVFYSKHGYVRRYVDILGNAIGCDAVPVEKLKVDMLAPYDKVLYIASIKNNVLGGLKKFADMYDACYKKLVMCGVGLTPYRNYMPARIKQASVSVQYEKFIPMFYMQGGFELEELSRTEKFSVAMRQRTIQASEVLEDEDKFFLDAINTPVDEVKLDNAKTLIDYLEGREVDTTLYSPPEITDEDEEKAFFEEMEAAAKSPENKEKALRKKLKK